MEILVSQTLRVELVEPTPEAVAVVVAQQSQTQDMEPPYTVAVTAVAELL
jgi:hypothetical protein